VAAPSCRGLLVLVYWEVAPSPSVPFLEAYSGGVVLFPEAKACSGLEEALVLFLANWVVHVLGGDRGGLLLVLESEDRVVFAGH
jgi:hypothetical protein